MSQSETYQLKLDAGRLAIGLVVYYCQQEALAKGTTPEEQIKELIEGYLDFVLNNPVMFEEAVDIMEKEIEEVVGAYLERNAIELGKEGMN